MTSDLAVFSNESYLPRMSESTVLRDGSELRGAFREEFSAARDSDNCCCGEENFLPLLKADTYGSSRRLSSRSQSFLLPPPPATRLGPCILLGGFVGLAVYPARPKLPSLLLKGWICRRTCTTRLGQYFPKKGLKEFTLGVKPQNKTL